MWERSRSTKTFSHRGCFSFGPEPIQSPDIWSPTFGPQEQTVPAHLVPLDKWSPRQLVPLDNWSPNIWSQWTNGPQDNWSPWTNGSQNWSPWTIGPQNLLLVFKKGLEHFLKNFDSGRSTLDIMDDFKPIFKKIYLCFGDVNQSLLFDFVQKHFFTFILNHKW